MTADDHSAEAGHDIVRAAIRTDHSELLEEIVRKVGTNGEALDMTQELLKRIIELLLPKAADDGPTLSELLAALLTTMRELLIVGRRNANGIDEILQRLDAAKIGLSGRQAPNGTSLHA